MHQTRALRVHMPPTAFTGHFVDQSNTRVSIARASSDSVTVTLAGGGSGPHHTAVAAVHNDVMSLWNLTGTLRQQDGSIEWSNAIVWRRTDAALAEDASVRPTVAVCISGQLRTFLDREVQDGFADQLHRSGYEYFLSTDTPLSEADPRLRIRLRAVHSSSEPVARPVGHCPRHTSNHRGLLPMAARLASCFHLMQKEEAERYFSYELVLRLRPDHLFSKRVPPIPQLFPDSALDGVIALADDQVALASRSDAKTMLLVPSISYATCASAEEWAHACTCQGCEQVHVEAAALGDHLPVPCCPMTLITAFGSTRSWRDLSPLGGYLPTIWRAKGDDRPGGRL